MLSPAGDDHGKGILAQPEEGFPQGGPECSQAEARLIHYDLAGRYSLNVLSAKTQAIDLADARPPAIYARAADDSAEKPPDA